MKNLYRTTVFLGASSPAPTIPVETLESQYIERFVCRIYGVHWAGDLQEGEEIPLGYSSRVFLASADEDHEASVGVFRCMLLAERDRDGSYRIGIAKPFLNIDEDERCIERMKAVEAYSSGNEVLSTKSDRDFLSVVGSVCGLYGLDFKDGKRIGYREMKPKTTFFAMLPTDRGLLTCDVSLERRIAGLTVKSFGAVLFPYVQSNAD